MTPTRLTLALIAATACFSLLVAVLLPRFADVGLAPLVIVLCVLVLEWRSTPMRADLEISVREPAVAFLGEEAIVEISVNPLPSIGLGSVEVQLQVNDRFAELPDEPWIIQPHENTSLEVSLLPVTRGMGEVEKLWLRWSSPWALMKRQIELEPELSVPITPNLTPVFDQNLNMVVTSFQTRGSKAVQLGGDGSEFNALREYIAGADPRAIDWKRSARYRKILSKEYETEKNQQVILAFDTGYLMCQKLGGIAKLDHAINAALLLSHICLRDGDRLGLMGFDAQIRSYAAPTSGVGSYHEVGTRLAHLDYSAEESNFTLATSHLLNQLQRRSLIIMFTDFIDTVSASLMADSLQRLAHHHLIIFVTLRDPYLAAEESRPPDGMDQMAQSVIAGSLLQERKSLMRRLELMGVRVLEVENHTAATALINEYLTVKQMELL